jgi:hypothetical protein
MQSNRISVRVLPVWPIAACAMAFFSSGAHARTYTITNNTMAVAKDGICGFREALAASSLGFAINECPGPDGIGASTINLAPLTYTAPAALEVWNHVDIRCPAGTCIIDAGNLNADLFTIDPENNPKVTLYRLTFRQPSANTNALSGVVVLGGTLTLLESAITGFHLNGLWLRAGSDHIIQGSTFSGNSGNGISVETKGQVVIAYSAMSGNLSGIGLWPETSVLSQSNTFSAIGMESAREEPAISTTMAASSPTARTRASLSGAPR